MKKEISPIVIIVVIVAVIAILASLFMVTNRGSQAAKPKDAGLGKPAKSGGGVDANVPDGN